MGNIYINQSNILTPFGISVETNWMNLIKGNSAVSKINSLGHLQNFHAGRIDDKIFSTIKTSVISSEKYTRLELFGIYVLQSLIEKEKLTSKTGLIISTTKGNINQLSNSIDEASIPLFAQKIADYFGFKTEPIVVCNACISGVLAVNIAKRFIEIDILEDAYVLALDELTDFVLTGFNSFQALDFDLCKPFDKNRKGVNLGEAVACVFISKTRKKNSFQIIGEASINDANHISGPSRTGEGLVLSMKSALSEANIPSTEIDYISAHGTATLYNDEMETIAFNRLQLQEIPTNSLKAFYGHTLGASGLLELIIAMKQSQEKTVLKSLNFNELGTTSYQNIAKKNQKTEIRTILKTSSGFGGSNAVILLKKIENEED